MSDRDGDRRRYLVVGSVILEIVTPEFKSRLENEYQKIGFTCLKDFINSQSVVHALFHLRHRNITCCKDKENCVSRDTITTDSLDLVNCQWSLLYSYSENPQQWSTTHICHCKWVANEVSLKDLDITLAGLLLVNCFELGEDDAVIRSLVKFKTDYLTDNTTGGICEEEFRSYWNNLTTDVLKLDPNSQNDLLQIEERPLDILEWYNTFVQLLNVQPQINERLRLDIRQSSDSQEQTPNEPNQVNTVSEAACQQCSHSQETPVKVKKAATDIYELGQVIFYLHHTMDLKPVMADMLGDITDYLGLAMDDTGINTSLQVTDGTIVGEDKLVFCFPYMCTLLICDMDGLLAETMFLKGQPRCITTLYEATVAVTLDKLSCIELYNLTYKCRIKTIQASNEVLSWGGIASIDKKLVVGVNGKLLVIEHAFKQETKMIDTNQSPSQVHVSGDIIYTSGKSTNSEPAYGNEHKSILYYNYRTGTKTHKFLPSPVQSMTTLKDGSLYVICEDGSLQHVSSDGRTHKHITRDILDIRGKCPILRYDKQQKKMICFDTHTGHVQVFDEL